jgi:hypothetical protein
MFLKLKPNGEIRLLADLVPYNKIIFKDHEVIPKLELNLRMRGRVKSRSTLELEDWYFLVRVKPEYKTYYTIKTPFGYFAYKVML